MAAAKASFELGDLVWAKMKNYPEWPGKIINSPNNEERKGYHYVFFFGTFSHSWMKDKDIKHHSDAQLANLSKRKLFGYEKAVEQIKKEFANKPKGPSIDSMKDRNNLNSTKIAKPESKPRRKSTDKSKTPDAAEKSSKKRKLSADIPHNSLKKAMSTNEENVSKDKTECNYAPLLDIIASIGLDEKEATPKKAPSKKSFDLEDNKMFKKKTFEVGDLVWAKMKNYPEWPGKIINSPNNEERKGYHYILFFGTLSYSWIKDKDIKHHSDVQLVNLPKRKLFGYEEAVEQIKKEFANKPKVPAKGFDSIGDSGILKSTKISKPVNKSPIKNTSKSSSSGKPDAASKSKKRKLLTEPAPHTSLELPVLSSDEEDYVISKQKKIFSYTPLFNAVLEKKKDEITDETVSKPPSEVSSIDLNDEIFNDTSVYDLGHTKVGFLGLGLMGCGLVKNLLRDGHNVTVWNRTLDKCNEFVELGAKKAHSAAEVASKCDIIFCCVSDSDAVQTIIYGENGILKGVDGCEREGNYKGYVEMTTLDADISKKNGEVISKAGLRYLEASLIGWGDKAIAGSLTILGSGSRTLFNDCDPCFRSISTYAYYLARDVGKSALTNIITSSFCGIMLAALSEVLALADSIRLPLVELLEVFELSGIISENLQKKGLEMAYKINNVTTYLKHQHKDLGLCLELSKKHNHPLPIASEADLKFTRAMEIGLADYDAAGVYLAYKKNSS